MTMRTAYFATIAIVFAAAIWSPIIHAEKPERKYYDGFAAQDTLITLSYAGSAALTKAVEIRATCAPGNRKAASRETGYGIAFGIESDKTYYSVEIRLGENEAFDPAFDTPHAILTVSRHQSDNAPEIIVRKQLTEGIELQRMENSIAVEIECQSGQTSVYAGNKNLIEVAEVSIGTDKAQMPMGVIAIGNPEYLLVVEEITRDPREVLKTDWTPDSLLNCLAASHNPIEGRWNYLDRDMDTRYSRLGGKYEIGITANNDGSYDIIYLGGADISRSDWKPGMRKGLLTPTQFTGHYDLVWYDATMQPIDSECSATLEQNMILRLDFPLIKATMRFAKRQDR